LSIFFIPAPHLLGSPRYREWPLSRLSPAPARAAEPPRTADVVIVGAGPAGVAVASALWHHGVRDVVLLDEAHRPCGRFFDRINVLKQRVLRSPYEHHPGVEGYRDCELLDFARLHWSLLTGVERREVRMAQAGHRSVVPVDVFEAYCRHVIATHQVSARTWQATVHEVLPTARAVTVSAGRFAVTAPFAVLCTGEERRPAPAAWWSNSPAPAEMSRVSWWDEAVPEGAGDVVVVGSGLTSAHLISNALTDGRRVRWVMREAAERYQCSDVNSAFFRAEGRARFDGLPWADRLGMMRAQRRASVMFEFRPLLERAEADGRLTVHRGSAVEAVTSGGSTAVVRLASGDRVIGDHVVLALGTSPSAGARLLPEHLLGGRDGWPDLDERTLAYRRAPRVLAVGAAAGMALGPAARNIDGHRVATARVAAAVADGLRRGGLPIAADGAHVGRAVAHV
jgi:cation diffusion facilitator CzcD-associated flavoprotein CzcO